MKHLSEVFNIPKSQVVHIAFHFSKRDLEAAVERFAPIGFVYGIFFHAVSQQHTQTD